MALIYCEKCGHEISDKASVCPNCGKSTPKSLNNRKRRIWIVTLLCLIVIFAVAITTVVYKSKKEEEERMMNEYLEKIDSIYSEANKNIESISDLYKEYDSGTDINSVMSATGKDEYSDYTPNSIGTSPTKLWSDPAEPAYYEADKGVEAAKVAVDAAGNVNVESAVEKGANKLGVGKEQVDAAKAAVKEGVAKGKEAVQNAASDVKESAKNAAKETTTDATNKVTDKANAALDDVDNVYQYHK